MVSYKNQVWKRVLFPHMVSYQKPWQNHKKTIKIHAWKLDNFSSESSWFLLQFFTAEWILFYRQMVKVCIFRRRRNDFVITATVWFLSGRLMLTSEERQCIIMQILVSVKSCFNGIQSFRYKSFQYTPKHR